MTTITDKREIVEIGRYLLREIQSECQHELGSTGRAEVAKCTLSKMKGIVGFLDTLQEVPNQYLRAHGADLRDALENVLNDEMVREMWANF